MTKLINLISFALFLCIMNACTENTAYERKLNDISSTLNTNIPKGLEMLKSIPLDSLSEANRNYYKLLKIKASSKLQNSQEADSTIFQILEYGRDHKTSWSPEALYYASIINLKLGDYPEALLYCNEALNDNPSQKYPSHSLLDLLILKAQILNKMQLHQEATTSIQQAILLWKNLPSSRKSYHSIIELGEISIEAGNVNIAEQCTNLATLSKAISPHLKLNLTSLLAKIYFHKKQYNKASLLIENILSSANPTDKVKLLQLAITINQHSQNYDKVRLYAYQLLSESDHESDIHALKILSDAKI